MQGNSSIQLTANDVLSLGGANASTMSGYTFASTTGGAASASVTDKGRVDGNVDVYGVTSASGSVGAIYRQFAVTLVLTMLFSALMALTLTPALSSAGTERGLHLAEETVIAPGERVIVKPSNILNPLAELLLALRGRHLKRVALEARGVFHIAAALGEQGHDLLVDRIDALAHLREVVAQRHIGRVAEAAQRRAVWFGLCVGRCVRGSGHVRWDR